MFRYDLNAKYYMLCLLCLIFTFFGCEKKSQTRYRTVNQIIFLSSREAPKQECDIFSMNPDGSNPVNLTRNISGIRTSSDPQISQNGTHIVFWAMHQGKKTLQILNLNDTTCTVLAELNTDNPQARISPDARQIVFSDKMAGRDQIFVINKDGTGLTRLSPNNISETEPEFSPDGKYICFTSKINAKSSIAIMMSDGRDRRVLTGKDSNQKMPSFSPNGSYIVYCSDQKGTMDIFYVDIYGGEIFEAVVNNSYDFDPLFTADGKKIVFTSNVRGMKYRDLVVKDLDSSDYINLTANINPINHNAVIIPDGTSLIFESIKFGDGEICRIGIDGEGFKNLTNSPGWDLSPSL